MVCLRTDSCPSAPMAKTAGKQTMVGGAARAPQDKLTSFP